ncbi:MAG: 30S ribosomal protein THX [Flavobacteriales bacterium]|nr:30S ribosomal protein THX [Flavobacteriales bacterium]
MGKGDQRSKKGKRVRGSFGVSRPRSAKGRGRYTVPVSGGTAVIDEVAETPKKSPTRKAKAKKAAPAKKTATAKKAAPEKKAAPVKKVAAKKSGADNLTKIEGIGPKIAETLTAAGVDSYASLAKSDPAKLAEIIADVRGNHVTDTWPEQAALAAEDKWDELKELQDNLDGGKRK